MKWMPLALVLIISSTSVIWAEDGFPPAGDESANYQTEVLIENLDNPCGLVALPAAGPEDYREILFIESGAGRVVKFSVDKPGDTQEVIKDLAVDAVSDVTKLRMSAWRLGLITPTKLAVLGGTEKSGVKQLCVYVLPVEDKVLDAAETDHAISVIGGETSNRLHFPGMAVGEEAVFITSADATGGGTISNAALAANRVEEPRSLLSIKANDDLRWPSGLCLSPSGSMQFLVTGNVGELADERDGRLTFIVPANGNVALELACGLFDVVDLAYSLSGQLYAIDLGWHDDKAGGVYRLDDARFENRPACRAVKIAKVLRPTSLLFGSDATLYVTSLGSDENAKRGSVIKITGEF